MQERLSPLLKTLKKALLPLRSQRLILAFSGGLDSLSLGQALSECAPDFSIEWSIAHIDHGPAKDPDQRAYRDQAARVTQTWADAWKVAAHIVVAPSDLGGDEQALRNFRYQELGRLVREQGAARVMTAHHLDDLLETRVMRLIRGTGAQGLQAMETLTSQLLRPWLESTRAEIAEFASQRGLQALDDPSNKNSTYLRNWIRNEWLPQLEARQPGAKNALARSLENLAAAAQNQARQQSDPSSLASATFDGPSPQIPWDRRQFRDLSAFDRKALIARKLRDLGTRDFSQTHVEEILKRLDTVQKRLDFTVAGMMWQINAQQISVTRP